MEDGIPAEGPPSPDKVVGEAPSTKTVVGLQLPARRSNLVIVDLRRSRGLSKLELNSYVKLMKWDHLLAVALSEEYTIPFLGYLDGKSYQRVAEDGMYIRNHDFNETAELVCLDF